MPEEKKFRGMPIYFGAQEHVVPTLSIRQLRENFELLSEPVTEITPANVSVRMGKLIPVIGVALRRNYPEIKDDDLFDLLDLRTFSLALIAIQQAGSMNATSPEKPSDDLL